MSLNRNFYFGFRINNFYPMAKVKQNNFLDTVDEVFTNAKQAGVLHLMAGGSQFNGRQIEINGKAHFHFGTTGYLGLEQDPRLKAAAVHAIEQYGTQFPLSKSYISHPLYAELEEKIRRMYSHPVVITKNSTLGHMAVIPCAVRDEDGVILDHQVHWSVQNASQILKVRGIPVEMIRHNNLEMLEDKIRELRGRCRKIWYMADGVYSMYGDFAPVKELVALSDKYPQLHLYFDDVHGMSWMGKNGTGYVMQQLSELRDNMLLFGTLSKTFGASGAVLACADKKLHSQIKTYGGPLTFSAQLEPASVAAATASADIHLSEEIYQLQSELQERIGYFNQLLKETDLPLVEENDSPVFYIGTGMPISGYSFVRRLMNDGFYVNLGLYPAVPVKNTGVRITISRHNRKPEIKALVEAMSIHYPKALEETGSDMNRVRKAFRMPTMADHDQQSGPQELQLTYTTTIAHIDKAEWDASIGTNGVFNWNGQHFLERVFNNEELPENNWGFHYFIIRDRNRKPVLITFFSHALWKDDLLSPASISEKLELKRQHDPYYMTSYVLSMGSLFTEGKHLFLDDQSPLADKALDLLLKRLEELDQQLGTDLIVLRDFEEHSTLNRFFHERGFVKVSMPEAAVIEDLHWQGVQNYIGRLSARNRRHFHKDVEAYEELVEICIRDSVPASEISHFYRLYENVKKNNPGLNTFSFPQKLFEEMNLDPSWEFIILRLKDKRVSEQPVGVMFCYRNPTGVYVPSFIGMDYDFARKYNIYRQLLFQTICRAGELGFSRIDFGMTAAFEKKKLGATIRRKHCYIQAKDNFSMELLGLLHNEG